MMNAVIYCRVSSKEQVEGYSLAAQEKICRQYAERNGYTIVKVFIEKGESAKTTDRTELKNLLQYSAKNCGGLNAIIVYKLDRLSRNMADYTDLIRVFSKFGIDLKSATENIDETPVGKLTKNMLATLAQFENDVRSERTKSGMRQAVLEGRWCWTAPFGYRNSRDSLNKPLCIPSNKADFVVEAFSMAESGVYRHPRTAIEMNWIPAFAGMTDEEKINRGFRV